MDTTTQKRDGTREIPIGDSVPETEQTAAPDGVKSAAEADSPDSEKNKSEANSQAEASKGDTGTESSTEASADSAGDKTSNSDKYLRLLAEYDNYRKRSQKERDNIYTDAKVDTVARFLPVYDNLKRALQTETADEAYKKGVEMTFHQLQEIFQKLGVEEIEAEGQTFDPSLHNAVMHIEDDTVGESVIVQEFEKGFKLGDRVIRFSMVKVAN